MRRLAALIACLLVFPLFAQQQTPRANDPNGDGYTTILLPIAVWTQFESVHGMGGSQWRATLWMENASSQALDVQPYYCWFEGCGPSYRAGWIGAINGISINSRYAALLQIPSNLADDVHFSLRLYESSINAQPSGVEVPLIRENNFLHGSTTLLAVPSSQSVRSTLRLYDPRVRTNGVFRIDFVDMQGRILATTDLIPSSDYDAVKQDHRWALLYPSMVSILDIARIYPALLTVNEFSVVITPDDPTMEYWAMVSVTDNATQHVTLITPN